MTNDPSQKMILFVDDEERRMTPYVEKLEISGFKVDYYRSVDDAWTALEKQAHIYSLVICDIMMPPGRLLKDANTNGGLRTGILFYPMVRQKVAKTHVIILTNVSTPDVEKHFRSEPYCTFLRKEFVFPFELVEEVKKILEGRTNSDAIHSA